MYIHTYIHTYIMGTPAFFDGPRRISADIDRISAEVFLLYFCSLSAVCLLYVCITYVYICCISVVFLLKKTACDT